jgi:anti-anti-sigma factor
MALTLVHTAADSHDLWVLSGRLDAAAEADFRRAFAQASDHAVLLDLSNVGFIDSKGLGLLAWLTRAQLGAGGRVVLCGARGYLRDAMERVRLHEVVDILDDRAAAENWLRR